jgi:AcrR family transcriptional regulator
MPRKAPTEPRKTASQSRSRLTVDALLQATARILIKEGYDRASTNHIAAVAGVSVGSLYQYFPNKEALVAALIDRHSRKVMAAVRGELAAAAHLPLAEAVRKLVWVAVEAHRIDPTLHRVLSEQIPRVGKLKNIEAFSQQNYVLFEDYLRAHRSEIQITDLKLAAFVCVTSIEAVTHNAVLHRKISSEEDMDALVAQTGRLIVAYLLCNDHSRITATKYTRKSP